MNIYETVVNVNNRLIENETVMSSERHIISETFLANVSDRRTVIRFHNGVKAPKLEDGDPRRNYPELYIPPYNDGKKHMTLTGVTPQTHILSSNAYELEILRLLALFNPGDKTVTAMLSQTRERLATACFAGTCFLGECYETGLVILRYINIAYASDLLWQHNLLEKTVTHLDDKKRHSGTRYYLWLTLSELPDDAALPYIKKYENELYKHLSYDCLIKCAFDLKMKIRYKYIIRNCLTRLEKYEYLIQRRPYINDHDGRLHFDTSEN
ncbi:MAG: hypothetical protein ACYCWE_08195 [Eubacteriales bacterium]